MQKLQRLILFFLALALLGLFTLAQPASAAGLTVQPAIGNYATTFSIHVGGFAANESVAVAVVLSDGSAVGLPGVMANSTGAITVSFMPYNEWPSGPATLVATGVHSGYKYTSAFQLVRDTSTVLIGGPGTGAYTSSFSVQASGFNPGEVVAAAAFFSDGTSVGLPAVTADGAGNVAFSVTPYSEWPVGAVTVAATGTQSAHRYITAFQLVRDAAELSTEPWTGAYYNSIDFSGAPALVRSDANVIFNWGAGSPAPQLAADNFSVRWTTTRTVSTAGNYTILATADDGVRVWVDDQLVIDGWYDHSATSYTATVNLAAGQHTLRVDYYEHLADALLSVAIVKA